MSSKTYEYINIILKETGLKPINVDSVFKSFSGVVLSFLVAETTWLLDQNHMETTFKKINKEKENI